jgi:hypothetical protein
MAGSNPLKLLWLMPLYVAALILAARLLGRLGWRLAEAMPDDEGPTKEDAGSRNAKNFNPPPAPKTFK